MLLCGFPLKKKRKRKLPHTFTPRTNIQPMKKITRATQRETRYPASPSHHQMAGAHYGRRHICARIDPRRSLLIGSDTAIRWKIFSLLSQGNQNSTIYLNRALFMSGAYSFNSAGLAFFPQLREKCRSSGQGGLRKRKTPF